MLRAFHQSFRAAGCMIVLFGNLANLRVAHIREAGSMPAEPPRVARATAG